MPKTLIHGNPTFEREYPEDETFLEVSELFMDTIQGENFVGWPAAFLRLQGCTQNCIWCDTKEVWRFGNPYGIQELIELFLESGLVDKLAAGQHLVLTGGSPLRQQDQLVELLEQFELHFGFHPFIEIENECTLMPSSDMIHLVDLWNNSPKLASSKNSKSLRYQPTILKKLSELNNSWFKFVVGSKEDWQEIETDFLSPGLISRDQIVLMPLGATRTELEQNREIALQMAIDNNVRFSTREHIVIWDKKTGV